MKFKYRTLNIPGKIWALPITLIGLVMSMYYLFNCRINKRRYKISFENNALTFTVETNSPALSITFGNVILHTSGNINTWNSQTTLTSYCGNYSINLGKHEEMHTYQMEKGGIFWGIKYLYDDWRDVPDCQRKCEQEADEYARIT
jgi:hypothetical protein